MHQTPRLPCNISTYFVYLLRLFCVLACASCGVGGDVVKVTEVNDTSLNSLREADVARLEQIKQARDSQEIDPTVSNLIEKTPVNILFNILRLGGQAGLTIRWAATTS